MRGRERVWVIEMRLFTAGAASQTSPQWGTVLLVVQPGRKFPHVFPQLVGSLIATTLCLSAQVFLNIHSITIRGFTEWIPKGFLAAVWWNMNFRTRSSVCRAGCIYTHIQHKNSTEEEKKRQEEVVSNKMNCSKVAISTWQNACRILTAVLINVFVLTDGSSDLNMKVVTQW